MIIALLVNRYAYAVGSAVLVPTMALLLGHLGILMISYYVGYIGIGVLTRKHD